MSKLDLSHFNPWTLNENVGIANSVSMFQVYGKDRRLCHWESRTGLRLFRRHTPLPRRIRVLYAPVGRHWKT